MTDERTERLLKQVADQFDKEDTAVRERQIIQWKKLKYYWAGFQRLWWSEVAHDWRVFDEQTSVGDNDGAYYDKPINVFRAYLESIIAALSITIPAIKCFPDDAENVLDLETARAGDKIAELIGKHNEVSLLWLHALFIYCTEGMVACYNYDKEDYKFGEYSVPKTQKSEETVEEHTCPNCGTVIPQDMANQLLDQFDPDNSDVQIDDLLHSNKFCPECQQEIEPTIQEKQIIVERIVGSKTKPKSRQCLECYGGLFVKVSNYARKQEDCAYLIFSYETHYSNALERYEALYNEDGTPRIGSGDQGNSGTDLYARWGRLSTQYFNEYPNDTVTVKNVWLRPSAFNVLKDKEDVNYLKKKFPDGARCVFVNDLYCESENESLDDSWTITHNPLSDYIHFDPLGLLLTSVQEITNDLTSLILQTIEHGIPQTFASPDVLNFDAYRQMEVSPGAVIPTKQGSGKEIGQGFFTVKTAALSGEILPFTQQVQEAGQLVSGALPSLFGGSQPGGSKTAAQYSMSRAQAQQRLGTPWKMFNVWWKDIFGKVIPRYIKNLKDDEKFVQRDAMGGFVNVFIHKAELEGKIGSVELDSSEELPATWAQKKDVIMQLLQSGNQEVMAAIGSPENIPKLAEAIGLEDFFIPGADDREKQYEEIRLLLQSEPIPGGVGPDGQPVEEPSVSIEPDVDNDPVHIEICKGWAVGPIGRDAKINNPKGYKNVLLHLKMHVDNAKAQMAPPAPAPQGKQPVAAKLPMGASNGPQ